MSCAMSCCGIMHAAIRASKIKGKIVLSIKLEVLKTDIEGLKSNFYTYRNLEIRLLQRPCNDYLGS